ELEAWTKEPDPTKKKTPRLGVTSAFLATWLKPNHQDPDLLARLDQVAGGQGQADQPEEREHALLAEYSPREPGNGVVLSGEDRQEIKDRIAAEKKRL